jgi:putative transposase
MPAPRFVRKRNRLPRSYYVGQNWYFVTACTRERRPLFSQRQLVETLLDILQAKCCSSSFNVYAYCFMPDHAHLELVGVSGTSDLIVLLHDVKGVATAQARDIGIRNLWEKSFHDHILRSDDNHDAVAWYIFNNPVRKGLVKDPRDWPYSGSWMLDWKKAVAPIHEYVPPWK